MKIEQPNVVIDVKKLDSLSAAVHAGAVVHQSYSMQCDTYAYVLELRKLIYSVIQTHLGALDLPREWRVGHKASARRSPTLLVRRTTGVETTLHVPALCLVSRSRTRPGDLAWSDSDVAP